MPDDFGCCDDDVMQRIERSLHGKSEALMMQTNEIESLRQQLAECERESETLARQYHSMKCSREDLHYKLAAVTKERDELVEVVSKAVKLNSFREFNDHIPAMKAALAKVGADKTGER